MNWLAAALLAVNLSAATPARLNIAVDVGTQAGPTHTEQATLTCSRDHTHATGFLRAQSKKACQVIRRGTLQRVARAQASQRLCSQIYSGPQQARITGTVGSERINLTITRTDSCRTADWNRLEALLGPPER